MIERGHPLFADSGRASSEIPKWLQEFREKLVFDEVPDEENLEPTSKRREDLGKHSVYTHKDRNCGICQRTNITRSPCRRRNGGAAPRAEIFGDLITAEHKVLSETMMNGEHAFATSGGIAWRRRQRRLRAFRRYVLWHSKMEIEAALVHTSRQCTSTTTAATQTVNYVFVSAAATYAAPASVHVIEYVTPTPVIENIAPVPAVTSEVPSHQLPPACTTTTDTTDDNLDMTGLV